MKTFLHTTALYIFLTFSLGNINAWAGNDHSDGSETTTSTLKINAEHEISAALAISGVDFATSEICGNFDVIMRLSIQNTGEDTLDMVRATLDLSANTAFDASFLELTDDARYISSNAQQDPVLNTNWDGGLMDAELFNGTTGLLYPDEIITIEFSMEIDPDLVGGGFIHAAQATVRARVIDAQGMPVPDLINGGNLSVSDLSDAGYDPKTENENYPGHVGTADDPTLLGDCWKDVTSTMGCESGVQVTLGPNGTALIVPDVVLEPHFDECDDITYPDGGYYRVKLVDAEGNDRIPPVVTCSDIGETFTVKVENIVSCGFCWGTIYVEDKTPPVIQCSADYNITCDSLAWLLAASPSGNFQATAVDNCCLESIWHEDDVQANDCGFGVVNRTWYASDCYQNESSCVQEITIIQNDPPLIVWPNDIQHDCNLSPDQLTPEDLEGDVTNPVDGVGFVFLGSEDDTWIDINTGRIYNKQFDPEFNYARPRLTNDDYCGQIGFNSKDKLFELCPPYGFHIRRTWTALDWCNLNYEQSHTQIIRVVDDEAPVLVCPSDKTISTSHTDCLAFLSSDPVNATDNCDSNPLIVDIKYTDLYDLELPSTQVGPGTYRVKYTVSDACGNEAACVQHVTVKDIVPPVAICDVNTNISLTAVSGWADLCASVVNDESYDNCSVTIVEIRAPDLPFPQNEFQPCIRFFCTNIDEHILELRVWDDGNANGLIGPNDPANFDNDPTNDDNWNLCWASVLVEDKQPPNIICPADVTVNCTEDFTDPLFTGGFATGQDACSVPPVTWEDIGIVSCLGSFTRRWTTTKDVVSHDGSVVTHSAVCDQMITVVDPTPVTFELPSDLTLDCPAGGTEPEDLEVYNTPTEFYDDPRIVYDCEDIGMTHEDEFFDLCAPSSFKIERTWHLLDWCNPNFDIRHIQTINVMDLTQPEIFVNGAQGPDKNDPNSPAAHNIFVEITNNDLECHEWAEIRSSATDDCSSFTISNNSPYSETGNIHQASGFYPKGSHSFSFFAIDDCGNVREERVNVTVVDAKGPQAQCLTQAINIKSTGEATVDATVMDGGSNDNCSDRVNLTFALQLVDADDNPIDDPEAFKVFDCSHAGTFQYVRLWVYDEAGNGSYCLTTIFVQDNDNFCNNAMSLISGSLQTAQGDKIDKVDIYVNGDVVLPQVFGNWQWSEPINQVVTVHPEKDIELLNGVTTEDIIYLKSHLLGRDVFNTVYLQIAGDINNDKKLSPVDVIYLRQAILRKTDAFPNNSSWRFLNNDYTFTTGDALNENWLENEVDLLTAAGMEANFTGIKIGDLTGDVSPNFSVRPVDERFDGFVEFTAMDAQYQEDEVFGLEFKADDFEDIIGYQFTLEFDPNTVEYIGFEQGVLAMSEENLGLNQSEEGKITMSWDDFNGADSDARDVLFALRFKTKTDVVLSDHFDLTSGLTKAEGYRQDGSKVNLRLKFTDSDQRDEYALYQNTPNPFESTTAIGFHIPNAGDVEFVIRDIQGREVSRKRAFFKEGYNKIEFENFEVNGHGSIYTYEMKTMDFTATKKMLVIRH